MACVRGAEPNAAFLSWYPGVATGMASKSAGMAQRANLWATLLSVSLYKRSAGTTLRSLTFLGLMVFVLWGAAVLHDRLIVASYGVRVGIPTALVVVGVWLAFRLVNYPPFADFLAETEWEMRKVTWPTWSQLKRATAVVITVTLLMAAYLYTVDFVWMGILRMIGVLWVPTPEETPSAAMLVGEVLRNLV